MPEVYDLVEKQIRQANKDLPDLAKVRKFTNLYKEFDADDDELTRTRKLRRGFVEKRYKDILIGAVFRRRQRSHRHAHQIRRRPAGPHCHRHAHHLHSGLIDRDQKGEKRMDLMLMTLTTGIMVGGIYALVALGWVLIYKCSGVLNLAMGEMTLIGAYVSLSFYSMGVPFLLSLLFSLIIGFILGVLTERIFLDRLIGEPVLTVIMVTVGLSFFFKGTVEFIWGTDTRVFTPPVFSIEPVRLGPLIIGQVYLWSFVAAIILLVVFVCFFKYTRWGLAMQATADDEMAALSAGGQRTLRVCRRLGHRLHGGRGGRHAARQHQRPEHLRRLPRAAGAARGGPGRAQLGARRHSWAASSSVCCRISAAPTSTGTFPGGVKEIAPFAFMAVFLLFKPYGIWGWERIERV